MQENIRQEERKAAKKLEARMAAKKRPFDPIDAEERAAERRPGRVVDRMLSKPLQATRAWPSGDK